MDVERNGESRVTNGFQFEDWGWDLGTAGDACQKYNERDLGVEYASGWSLYSEQSGQAAGVRRLSLLCLRQRPCATQLTWGVSVTPEASSRQHMTQLKPSQA